MRTACEQEPCYCVNKYIDQGTGSPSHKQHFSNFHGHADHLEILLKRQDLVQEAWGVATPRPHLEQQDGRTLALVPIEWIQNVCIRWMKCQRRRPTEWNPQSQCGRSSRDGFLQTCLHSHVFSQKLDKEVNTKGYKWSSGLQQWKCQN